MAKTAVAGRARPSNPTCKTVPSAPLPLFPAWDRALADYCNKLAATAAMPIGDPGEDEATEQECRARDHLIENVKAPGPSELAKKIEIALAAAEDFETMLFDGHAKSIAADFNRLTGIETRCSAPAPFELGLVSADPGERWEARVALLELLTLAARQHPGMSYMRLEGEDPVIQDQDAFGAVVTSVESLLLKTRVADSEALSAKLSLLLERDAADCFGVAAVFAAIMEDVEAMDGRADQPRAVA